MKRRTGRLAAPWRRLLLAVLAPGLMAAAAAAQSVTPTTATTTKPVALHLGSTPWTPFTNVAGKPRFAIDLVEEALRRLRISNETTIVPEGALTKPLLDGKFDGSPALWRDKAREDKLIYSKPYLENRLVLVGRKGFDVSAPALKALAGRRIVLVDGYAYGDELKVDKGPEYVAAATVEESLEKVLSGQADYVLMDDLVVQYLVTNYPEQVKARLAIGVEPLLVRTLHFAVRRDVTAAQSIIDRFDAELVKMIADHSYHRLLQLGWIQADVDGDGRTELVPASDQMGSSDAPVRRYELVTVTANPKKPEGKKRFYLGGKVYDDWGSVPEQYKVLDANRTPWGSQTAPIFSFKW